MTFVALVVALLWWRALPHASSSGEASNGGAKVTVDQADLSPGEQKHPIVLSKDRLLTLEVADSITRESRQISRSEAREMMDFIRAPRPQEIEVGEWHQRVNSILNALRVQREAPEGFADFLISEALRRDDPVLGLYALQHLSMWLPKEMDPVKQQAIKDLFDRLMRSSEEPMAGTAVLMSSDLERQHVEGFDPVVIENAAIRLVANKQAPQDVRVSALHACCDRDLAAVLEDARHIANDKGEVSVLRKAAIHAIGRMGQASDLPLLAEISKEGPHLAAATTPATQRISQRIQKP